MVNHLKQKCKEEIEQYERCLKANTANASTCTPQLERLWMCSEANQPNGQPLQHEPVVCECDPPCKQ